MQLHELADVVEHVVVLGRGGRHLLDDGGHVAEDGGVQERCGRGKTDSRVRLAVASRPRHIAAILSVLLAASTADGRKCVSKCSVVGQRGCVSPASDTSKLRGPCPMSISDSISHDIDASTLKIAASARKYVCDIPLGGGMVRRSRRRAAEENSLSTC